MIPQLENLTEAEVRQLRDNIFGPITNLGWEGVRDKWMDPTEVKWLIEHQPKETK